MNTSDIVDEVTRNYWQNVAKIIENSLKSKNIATRDCILLDFPDYYMIAETKTHKKILKISKADITIGKKGKLKCIIKVKEYEEV